MNNRITAIEPQKRNRQRVNVYIDGAYAFSLNQAVAAQLNVGAELTDEVKAIIDGQERIETARQQAERFLSYRPRSVAEVRQRLAREDLDEESIDGIISNLRKRRLLDDGQFANYWVEQRDTFRPRGLVALRQELRQKGVDKTTIDKALTDHDDLASARRAAAKRLRRWADLPEETFRHKVSGHLQRRGFPYGICKQVVNELWAEIEATKDR
jgi:regulatory protein